MIEVDYNDAGHICAKGIYKIYNRLCLPGVVIYFQYIYNESFISNIFTMRVPML